MFVRKLKKEELAGEKERLTELFNKYYAEIAKHGADILDASSLLSSVDSRMKTDEFSLYVWGEDSIVGFLTVDWKKNAYSGRSEGVIWTVWNPNAGFKGPLLKAIEDEGWERGADAIVFFAEYPIVFNKLVSPYGYNLTLGYFEKSLKEEGK